MGFLHLFGGLVKLELISASFHETVRELNLSGIVLYRMQQRDLLTGSFWVRREDADKAIAICRKREGKIQVAGRYGCYWLWKGILKRPVLIIWLFIVLAFSIYLPGRIWFVQVEGNDRIPGRQIIAAAEDCGIRFGASRREIRSEKVKNALLASIPELQWAGVNTSGCVATICVRERAQNIQPPEGESVCSMVAERDGFILSASATKGNLLVQPGQTVVAGQLLISGYTDCGIVLRAERAEGEIFAQTNRELRTVIPTEQVLRREDGEEKKKISLLLGKKRIFLWKDSGISTASCGRMYEEYYITLPGGFRLPLSLCIERFPEYREETYMDVRTEVSAFLGNYARTYLVRQMTAGEIMQARENVYEDTGCLVLEGTYSCREMIGRMRFAQIGEIHG